MLLLLLILVLRPVLLIDLFFFPVVFCSAYYLQSCGANRRTAGVVTDIDRPDAHVCGAARSRWKERRLENTNAGE